MDLAQQHNPAVEAYKESKESIFRKFFAWCESQEKYRFGWLAAILASHGCIITPLTMLAIVTSGNNIILWSLALVAMGTSLITNLAAMPTKITIPVFFAGILLDIFVVATCMFAGFNIASTYQ